MGLLKRQFDFDEPALQIFLDTLLRVKTDGVVIWISGDGQLSFGRDKVSFAFLTHSYVIGFIKDAALCKDVPHEQVIHCQAVRNLLWRADNKIEGEFWAHLSANLACLISCLPLKRENYQQVDVGILVCSPEA